MRTRKIDAIDQFEVDIVEAGLAAWNGNKGGSKLSKMTSAWRAMTSVALTAPDAPESRSCDGKDDMANGERE
jgi:hypothetical protein